MNTPKDKARKLIKKGDFKKARSLLKSYSGKVKNDPEAWFLLSAVAGQLGLYQEVVDASTKVLAINPGVPAAQANLANGLTGMGRYAEAIQQYGKALALDPNNISIIYNYAHALYCAGKKTESVNQFLKVLERMPAHVEAHYQVGTILIELADFAKGIPHLLKAESLNPGLPDIQLKLADAFRESGQLEKAEHFYRKAGQAGKPQLNVFLGLVAVQRYQGKITDALDTCKDGLSVFPGNIDLQAGIADIHERQGELQQAYDIIRPIVDSGKESAGIADTFSRICMKFDACDDAIAYGRKVVVEVGQTDTSAQARVHFALGKMLDKLQRFDEAFGHFEQANKCSGFSFNAKAHEARIATLIKTYAPETVRELPRSSCASDCPVFIIGMPRSGTSLVEQILASHSQVYGAGELNDINLIVATLGQTGKPQQQYPGCMRSITTKELDSLAEGYLQKLRSFSADALRVTDKMPHNFLNLGLIAQLFPRARIIHCVRDPMDTCLSIYFQSFNRIHDYATDLASTGAFYCTYRKLMKHWQQVLELPFLEISYEGMVSDQSTVSREMIAFCGLEWEDQCLQFHKTARTVSTASYDQVRTPIYTQSVERWRNYEDHLAVLKQALA